jgi:hypothetical protein
VVSSSGEMYCCAGLVSGVYVSGRMSSSKNISLLKSMNLSMLTSMGLVSVYLIIFQNCLGLYFRMSGSSNWSLARCLLQLSLKRA